MTAYQNGLAAKGVTINTYPIPNTSTTLVVFMRNGGKAAMNIVSNDGGTVLQAGGISIAKIPIAGTIASMIATPLQAFSGILGAFHGGKYTVQSAGTTIIPTSGDGAIIFQ